MEQPNPEIYEKAAEVLKERGWFRGASQEPDGTAVCTSAALCIAAGLGPYGLTESEADSAQALMVCEAMDYMAGRLGRGVIGWNDDPERTEDEVLTELHECAAELKAGA